MECVVDCSLVELRSTECYFTWTNNQSSDSRVEFGGSWIGAWLIWNGW